MADTTYHIPVLLKETVDALEIDPNGIYLDGTAGGGGHSKAIASRLTDGRLIALDRDPDAVKAAGAALAGLPATVVQSNFTEMDKVLSALDIPAVDGILLDIGVSSHQLDTGARGFSFHMDAPLDMRMSQSGQTAADLVNTLDERALADIFFTYGEERFSRQIARAICRVRQTAPITTTLQLADIIASSVPAAARRDGHPARRVFQALRIEVNHEMDALQEMLEAALRVLRPGGRLTVLTYHSLEDRMVKNFMRAGNIEGKVEQDFFGNRLSPMRPVNNKVIVPTAEEQERNPRSRSAKLRIAEKV